MYNGNLGAIEVFSDDVWEEEIILARDIELVECCACKGRGSDLYTGKDCSSCCGRGWVPVQKGE